MEPGELLFGAATDPGQVSAALATRYRIHVEPASSARWTCLDTADWRLHRNDMTLRDSRRGRRGQLLLSAGASRPITAPSPGRQWPRRVETLPASPLREQIAPAVGVRALLPLAEVDVRSLVLRVLDGEEKTRVRVQVDQQRLANGRSAPLPLRVVVAPLRGYERDAERCAELLSDAIDPLGANGGAVVAALTAAGHVPGEPVVPALTLDPDAPAVMSFAGVLRRWIDIIDSLRPGVLADVDIEYLHDMRTAVRATRSLLRLSGNLLPEPQAARFAEDFAWLGRLTNPMRDLDVSLLELSGIADGDVIGDLEPLRRHLAGQRRRALRTLRTGLESPRATSLGRDWRHVLDDIAAPEPPGATTRALAAAQVKLAYRRIVKAAAGVTHETPPDHLHRLRRRCKRMRYLLEGYASVYPGEPHRKLLSSLKSLQNCLGDIQDADVQRTQLTDVAATLAKRGTPVDAVLAIGALRDRTARRDAEARRTLDERLRRFCGPDVRRRVRELGAAAA